MRTCYPGSPRASRRSLFVRAASAARLRGGLEDLAVMRHQRVEDELAAVRVELGFHRHADLLEQAGQRADELRALGRIGLRLQAPDELLRRRGDLAPRRA